MNDVTREESDEPLYVDGLGYRLPLEPQQQRYGCGIYEAGKNGLRMFVTDTGHVMPVQGRVTTADDLMQVYVWGRRDAEESARRGFIPPDPNGGYDDDA